MGVLAPVPELAVRKNGPAPHHRHKRVRSFAELNSAADGLRMAPARPSVLIALIDPKPLTRTSLLKMLGASLPDHVQLVGASSFEELLESSETGPSDGRDLLIVYVRSAAVGDDWVQKQLQLIRSERPGMPVIMISDRDDAGDVREALNHGVRGYIPTSIASEVAIAALTLIAAGGTFIPPDAVRPLAAQFERESVGAEEVEAESAGAAESPATSGPNLTSRELAVVDLLREGNPNKVIAKKLDMREGTVKVHVRNILKKLRVSNRTHAATVANRLFNSPS